MTPILYVVHCIDTEGPLAESIESTFERLHSIFNIKLNPSHKTLKQLQKGEINLGGIESKVAKVISPKLLNYNDSWEKIDCMLSVAMSHDFRNKLTDSSGNGWIYSWHCLDHLGYSSNPRNKDLGYGKVFHKYREFIKKYHANSDEINWHFHPLSLTRKPLAAATSFSNSNDILLSTIAKRILDDAWFPVVNRPGFHSERIESSLFLEQWIPFDYANQFSLDQPLEQQDLSFGRFGDWRRSPNIWSGYHPHHDDYQSIGNCRRIIFRCLNVGTRHRCVSLNDVKDAFQQARDTGFAILAVSNHDYRDILEDVDYIRSLISSVKPLYNDVDFLFAGAHHAAQQFLINVESLALIPPPKFKLELIDNRLIVELISGKMFGPTPFLAIKTSDNTYFHDNLDEIKYQQSWSYVFDEQTVPLNQLIQVGIGSAGAHGGFTAESITI